MDREVMSKENSLTWNQNGLFTNDFPLHLINLPLVILAHLFQEKREGRLCLCVTIYIGQGKELTSEVQLQAFHPCVSLW